MFNSAFCAALVGFGLVLSASGQKHVVYPTLPPPPHTPQEVLLLFSGNHADERILLTLNNNRADEMIASVIVYTASGTAFPLPSINMVPQESKLVELSPLLQAAGLGHQELGWLKLSYSGVTLEMGAQLTLYPVANGPGVDSPRSLSSDFKSTERDAVFWMPEGAKALLALTNSSSDPILVKMKCGVLPEEFMVPGKTTATRQIELPDIGPIIRAGRIPYSCDLVSNGSVDALRPVGTVVATKYSAPIRFYDPKTATFPSLTAVGLDTSTETHVAIHNVTDEPIEFVPILREATLSEPYSETLPPQIIAPHQVAEIALDGMMRSFFQRGIERTTLTLKTSAPKGALIGSATQINLSNRLIEDIPLRTSNPPAFARGSYPLRWDQDYTNLVTVTNTAEETLRIGGEITAAGTVYVLTRTDIKPGATIIFDVDKWRSEGIPDVNGKTLPKDAAYGKLHWVEMSNGKKAGLLGRTSLTSIQNGRKSSFSCGSTCAYNFYAIPYFDLEVFTTLYSGTQQVSNVTDYTSAVNGQNYSYPVGIYPDAVYTSNASVANTSSDPNSNTNIVVNGNYPGLASMQYQRNFQNYTYIPDQEQCVEADSTLLQSGTTSVTPPQVVFSPVSDIPQGGTTTVIVTLKDSQGNVVQSSPVPIHLVLIPAGIGAATFADGTVDKSITSGGTFQINGVAASSSMDNIVLDARIASADQSTSSSVASPPVAFTVVSVALSLQTTGTMPADNSAAQFRSPTLQSLTPYTSTDGNGRRSCSIPYQVTGMVTPTNYTRMITLRRYATYMGFTNGVNDANQVNVNDQSGPSSLDTDPQSGGSLGKVYDVDAPSAGFAATEAVGLVRRLRVNFSEFAVLGDTQSNIAVSSNLIFYARSSCIQKTQGTDASSIDFEDSIAGDNQAALGITSLSNTLQ